MATTLSDNPGTILVASDNSSDAALVSQQLHDEFGRVPTSSDPAAAARDFERHRPAVLVLAFNSLEKAERYYLGLYRLCPTLQQQPHRTVILCTKDEVKRVYELCKKQYFDDYVLYWPMSYDMTRLGMTIHHALRELADVTEHGPKVAEFAAQARRLAELESLLAQRLAEGGQHIAGVGRALAQAEQDIDSALDGFSGRMAGGVLPDALTRNNAAALQSEIGRLKREQVIEPLRVAARSAAPLKAWAEHLGQSCAPHLETVRALNTLAERVQQTVLVVDDDEFQRKILASILRSAKYQVVLAGDGMAVLNQLRQARPDLVLMDVMMPGMDGVEVTRRMKTTPRFADIPVIMITGRSDRQVVTESLQAGAAGFVVKPVERDTLLAKVAQALRVV